MMDLDFSILMPDNRLFLDYTGEYSPVASFFRGDPRSDETYGRVIEEIRCRSYERHKLCTILADQNRRWQAPSAVTDNIRDLESPSCSVVATGQQAGLFGGPLFTLYKAVTAVRLARHISKTHGQPCVPLFWIEGDDDDFKEAMDFKVLDGDGNMRSFSFDAPWGRDRFPVTSFILNEEVEQALKEASAFIGPSIPCQLEAVSAIYRAGERHVDAFARWMLHLLGEKGLIMMLPCDRGLKSLAAPLFRREAHDAPRSTQCVEQVSAALEALGYQRQIKTRPGRVNLFYHNPGRMPLYRTEKGFLAEGIKMSPEETEELISSVPERFSPNVILRPVVQDYILPVVAYVAGPAETAYWAQLGQLHRDFDVPLPVVYPRMSVTAVEGKIRKLLDRYAVVTDELFRTAGRCLQERLWLPEGLENDMQRFIESVERSCNEVEERAAALDVNLRPPFRHFIGRTVQQWNALSRKVADTCSQKNDIVIRQVRRVTSSLFPGGGLQERNCALLQYCLKYGRDFIEQVFEEMSISCPWRHQILDINQGGTT